MSKNSNDFLGAEAESVLYDGLPPRDDVPFIPASLDDAGLDVYEFRIFCHLRRRAAKRVAWPGMRSIAQVTGISLGKVCRVIHSLQGKGYIRVAERPGNHRSNIYFIMTPQELFHYEVQQQRSPGRTLPENSVHENERCSVHARERKVLQREGTPKIKNPKRDSLSIYANFDPNKKKPQEGKPVPPAQNTEGGKPMASLKKSGNYGQQFLAPIQQGVEESFQSRPLGMPCLAVIKSETQKLGLPDSDAEAIYDSWLQNGFRTKVGKIRNWKAALRNWHRNHWLPSQKTTQAISDDRDAIAARFRRMRDDSK